MNGVRLSSHTLRRASGHLVKTATKIVGLLNLVPHSHGIWTLYSLWSPIHGRCFTIFGDLSKLQTCWSKPSWVINSTSYTSFFQEKNWEAPRSSDLWQHMGRLDLGLDLVNLQCRLPFALMEQDFTSGYDADSKYSKHSSGAAFLASSGFAMHGGK